MSNNYFQFKKFRINQDLCAMKVTTDACLFGAWAGEAIREQGLNGSLLDIGAGTGLISMLIAQKNEQLLIDAIEIDPSAAQQAAENVSSSIFSSQINIIAGDSTVYNYRKKYDIIVSNPPFFENDLASPDSKINAARHSGGLKSAELIAIISDHLSLNGHVFLLLPFAREKEIIGMIREKGFYIQKKLNVSQTPQHN